MNDDNQNGNSGNFFDRKFKAIADGDNFADVSFDDLLDPNAEIEARRSEAQQARNLEIARRADPFTGTVKANAFAAGDWLAGNAPPPRQALLEHPIISDEHPTDYAGKLYMPAGKAGMLVAPGGTGKTTVLMQLAISVATGLPWLGHYQIARKGRVLVALGEEDDAEMHRSLYYATKAAGITDSDEHSKHRNAIYESIVTYPLSGIPVPFVDADGNRLAFFNRLADYIEEEGPFELVILDPGSRFMGPEAETDNAQATQFVQCLETLTATKGAPTVLMAHHTNKGALGAQGSSQGDARGSSALVDGVRWVVNLRTAEQPFSAGPPRTTLEVTKTNYGPKGHPLELVRDDYGWRAMTRGERDREREEIERQDIERRKETQRLAQQARGEVKAEAAERSKTAKTDVQGML